MRLLSIVGARPQFVKLASFVRALERRPYTRAARFEHIIVHTGQHYDAVMSDAFFGELALPEAKINLGIGSGPHGAQTGAMLARIEEVFGDIRPDVVVVYGDTNSTLAGALAAAKLHLWSVHVEAGLRSHNRSMPEEVNRIVADHVCDLLLAPTPAAVANLSGEGLQGRTAYTGDLMRDAVLTHRKVAEAKSSIGTRLGLEAGHYGVVTVHRAENTDDEPRLERLITVLNVIAQREIPLIFPVHPRTRNRIRATMPGWAPASRLRLIEPVGYLDMLWLLDHAALALTDSGGLQKEAFFVGCPCITLRDETEWLETVELGGNVLVGTDPESILAAVGTRTSRDVPCRADIESAASRVFGAGDAGDRILDEIVSKFQR